MTICPTLLEALEYVAATLKLRHINEATDDEVEEALTMAKDAVAAAPEGKYTSQVHAQRNTPLEALQAILPYAERELESLDECQRRDGGLADEVAACEAAVENAQQVLEASRGKA